MQTIDLQEMITLEPLLAGTEWVKKNEDKSDIELTEVLEALVNEELPGVQTMGYLIDREVFTPVQQMLMVVLLDVTSLLPGGEEVLSMEGFFKNFDGGKKVSLEALDEDRKVLRDRRPRNVNATIQMFLRGYLIQRVYAMQMDKKDPSIISRNLFESSAEQLKYAFLHFLRKSTAGEMATFFATLKKTVLNSPPASLDDYEV